MNKSSLFAFAVILCTVCKCFGEIPSDIHKCRAGDVLCIAKATNDILRIYPNGDKGLGLPKIEPFHLNELVVSRTNGNSPLSLDLKFTDLDVFGLSMTNITKVVGFEKDPRNTKFEMYGTVPLFTLRGNYKANGRVLLLPVVGEGDAEINLKNFKSGVKVKLSVTDEDGKQRLEISQMKVLNEPESMKVRFENLFNGNKELGDELINVINTNWKEVWTELESGINDGYKQILTSLIGDVLRQITYDEFFSDEP